jgi:hypothetical protein
MSHRGICLFDDSLQGDEFNIDWTGKPEIPLHRKWNDYDGILRDAPESWSSTGGLRIFGVDRAEKNNIKSRM